MDMSPGVHQGGEGVVSGHRDHFGPLSCHVVKLLNDAVEKLRRTEQKERPELRGVGGSGCGTPSGSALRSDSASTSCWIRRGSRLPRPGRTSSSCRSRSSGTCLRRWPSAIWSDGALSPSKAAMPRWSPSPGRSAAHSPGILRWLQSRISNGMLQAMNSLVQTAKVRARGYRTTENFITMAYLVCGKLNVNLPSENSEEPKKKGPRRMAISSGSSPRILLPAHAETRAAPREPSTCSAANWPETALSPPQLALDDATIGLGCSRRLALKPSLRI